MTEPYRPPGNHSYPWAACLRVSPDHASIRAPKDNNPNRLWNQRRKNAGVNPAREVMPSEQNAIRANKLLMIRAEYHSEEKRCVS